MRLTRNRLRRALKATEGWNLSVRPDGQAWTGTWWNPAVTDVLDASTSRGFTRRMSVTQVELTDAGAAWLGGR